jgi:hypothetical protein
MNRIVPAAIALAAVLAACSSPPAPAEPRPAPIAPQPVALAPPPIPTPPPDSRPNYVVSVLVGGEPKVCEAKDLAVLGADALAYLGTCGDSDHRPSDTMQWDEASGAPLCVRLVFAPPASLITGAGRDVQAAEMLLPLGTPKLDGFVFVRSGEGPHDGFLGGDPVLLARLKQRAAGTLALIAENARR